MSQVKSIRGFNDIVDDIAHWQYIEKTLIKLSEQYGYREIRTPMLEDSKLFERSIGSTSDIVHKEMYTFRDKNEQDISLRPEGTASVVRACLENNLLYEQTRKLYYYGSMFRRERPQKGRLREFHQFGLECLGYDEPYSDIEQLCMINRLWNELNIQEKIVLELNYIAGKETRATYTDALKVFYREHSESMSDIDKRRWQENTLRLLDSKNPDIMEINKKAPQIDAYYTKEEKANFEKIITLCDQQNIKYHINPKLMRGLDYYSGLIYEWKSDELGAQSTVCGGGRYDTLFEQLGGKPIGACGFSIGIERLIALISDKEISKNNKSIHLITPDRATCGNLLALAERIRNDLPSISTYIHTDSGKIATLIKKALKKDADILVILGEEELNEEKVTIKVLSTGKQAIVSNKDIIVKIRELIA
jgi:histidyl-tRNA synthetase